MKKLSNREEQVYQARVELHKEKLTMRQEQKKFLKLFSTIMMTLNLCVLSNEYEQILQEDAPGKLRFFKRDRERDIAILSLILGTGLRVSEVASLTISSINFRTRYIKVVRKGDKNHLFWLHKQS